MRGGRQVCAADGVFVRRAGCRASEIAWWPRACGGACGLRGGRQVCAADGVFVRRAGCRASEIAWWPRACGGACGLRGGRQVCAADGFFVRRAVRRAPKRRSRKRQRLALRAIAWWPRACGGAWGLDRLWRSRARSALRGCGRFYEARSAKGAEATQSQATAPCASRVSVVAAGLWRAFMAAGRL